MSEIEQVGVITRAQADGLGLLTHGFQPLGDSSRIGQIEGWVQFMDRPLAEDDPSHKQIIPYGVVVQAGRVFLMERLSGGGEARLHGKLSLGVGGHVNPIDGHAGEWVHTTMVRELEEELHAAGVRSLEPIGFINDDTSPVGSVHLGVVYRIELEDAGSAWIRETDTLRGGFEQWDAALSHRERMETWSAFILDAFDQGHF